MTPATLCFSLLCLSVFFCGPCGAEELSNRAFQIQYDAAGIRSLKRTNDVHDTDYIAANGRLGPLLVRYRTTRNGDWRELRQMLLTAEQKERSITYMLGVLETTLASRSSASAPTGAGGLRALNDGVVPAALPPAGAGRPTGPGPGTNPLEVPVFTWSGARGLTQWVQYVFPDEQEVSSVGVFWVRPPKAWRVMYQESGQWKEVSARGSAGTASNSLSTVEFAPVKTMAIRLEATMEQGDTVSIAEWSVGPEPKIVPSRLNMSDRGWLEPTYYQLGSDYRGNLTYLLSYMSQMGGWSILDYALHFAKEPAEYLRLGYASSLSSWSLVNSGTPESGYGYWFPGRNNDGATGGGFMPEPIGRAWIGKQMRRGAWHYSAEEDVGYCGALRTHATIVTRDPVFGEIAYGGVLTRAGGAVGVIPRDGLRVRFHVIRPSTSARGALSSVEGRDDQRLHLELDHDGFAKEQPIVVSDALDRVEFVLENRTGGAHETGLSLAGLPSGTYTVSVDGRPAGTVVGGPEKTIVRLSVPAAPSVRVGIVRH